jgi:hypothetical protein
MVRRCSRVLILGIPTALILNACGGSETPTNPTLNPAPPSSTTPSACATVSPTSASYPNTGGSGTLTITAPSTCTWTSRSNVGWITGLAENTSGSDNAILPYSVAANTGNVSRSGTLTTGGRTISITQSASTFLEIRGNYTFGITIHPNCYAGSVSGVGGGVRPDWPAAARNPSWPVAVRVDSFLNGVTFGTVTGLAVPPSVLIREIPIRVYPTTTALDSYLRILQISADYTLTLYSDGGGPGPSRAADGRGEIPQGHLDEMFLVQSSTGNEWTCYFDST